MLEFVFRNHLRLAVHAALLFAVGLFISWPIVHYRLRALARLPLAIFRFVLRLIGPRPSIARIAGVIFCFNSVAIFIDMASGFHPLLPKLLGIWTGANVGMVAGLARQEGLAEPCEVGAGQWVPPARLVALCGLLTLVLELPSFWFALAMGMSLGHEVQSGSAPYLSALAVRAGAYAAIVMPLLLLSALAEAVAVRGAGRRLHSPPSGGYNGGG